MPKLYDPSQAGEAGLFVQEYTIKDVEHNTGEFATKDMEYIFKLETKNKEGVAFEKTMFFSANMWNRDKPESEQSFPLSVSNFFRAVGIANLPQVMNAFYKHEDLEMIKGYLIGKRIKVLSYASGTYDAKDGEKKVNYAMWNPTNADRKSKVNTFSVDTPDEEIIALFLRTQKESTYPNKFTPNISSELKKPAETETDATQYPDVDPDDVI